MSEENTIRIEILAQGSPINITLANPWYGINDDEVVVFQPRDLPKCDWCDGDLEEADNEGDDWQEKWVCPDCGDEHWFSWGMYGEDEITLTREEWEASCSLEYQRYLLKKRYGTPHPKSIQDYWIKS